MGIATDRSESLESVPLNVIDADGRVAPILPGRPYDAAQSILAALPANTQMLIPHALQRHRQAGAGSALTLLVPPRTPPETGIRRDDVVTGFLASGPLAQSILDGEACSPRERCFRALSAVLSDDRAAIPLEIVHTASPDEPLPTPVSVSADIILAHRGGDQYLHTAVASILQPGHDGRTILCFDQRPDPAQLHALAQFETLELYEVSPSPAGPYVPRQHFSLTSHARYVAFQDTDDFSLPARIPALLAFAEAHDADIVGCHELRCDELTRTVESIRLPLDANAGLRDGPIAVQLFATTVIRTDCLRRLGGFSTIRTFGADRQFQLRAHWSARMLNVDAFLYVRRLREGSLTTAVSTGMDSQVRIRANAAWVEAFNARKEGRIALDRSALRVEPSPTHFEIRDLRTGQGVPALLDPALPGGADS